jgi:tetratricopeptide (TPR) repeat protein
MHSFKVSLGLFLSIMTFLTEAAPDKKMELNQAVSLYHQAQYDSALAHLKALKTIGPWKKRDSLSLFQYLGMTSTKIGQEAEAVDYFSGLLDLDSLFQFPTNEDTLILGTFRRAQEMRLMKNDAPLPDTQDQPQALSIQILPAPVLSTSPQPSATPPKIGFAYGAIPLGAGWIARSRLNSGLSLGFIQASGILLSIYASEMQNKQQDNGDLASLHKWQWTQRISLSTALGAYIFSLIASAGD